MLRYDGCRRAPDPHGPGENQEHMQSISRRKFVALTATGIAAAPLASMARSIGGAITAQDVVDRIKKNIGVEWKTETVDTFKAGDPSTEVTGIATTALATLSVLERAVKAGANLIVTSEPTFFSRTDSPTPPVRRGFGPAGAAPAPRRRRRPILFSQARMTSSGSTSWLCSD